MKEEFDSNKFIEGFDTDFISILDETNMKVLIEDIKGELILDCLDMRIKAKLARENPEEEELLTAYILSNISKYGFFIHHLEVNAEYEGCAEIRKMFTTVVCDTFNIKRVIIGNLIYKSINLYRENIEL